MKNLKFFFLLLFLSITVAQAQTLYVGNASMLFVNQSNPTTATVFINGSFQNEGIVNDNGQIGFTNAFTNNGLLKGVGSLGIGSGWTNALSATVAPGNSLGKLVILGDYISSTSTMNIEIGGTIASIEHDQLNISGTANVSNGILSVSFYNGYMPVGGESFTIVDANFLMGTFASANLPTLTSPLTSEMASLCFFYI